MHTTEKLKWCTHASVMCRYHSDPQATAYWPFIRRSDGSRLAGQCSPSCINPRILIVHPLNEAQIQAIADNKWINMVIFKLRKRETVIPSQTKPFFNNEIVVADSLGTRCLLRFLDWIITVPIIKQTVMSRPIFTKIREFRKITHKDHWYLLQATTTCTATVEHTENC